MAEAPGKFWMVYGVGQGCPTVRHPSRTAAESEARRLARAAPGIVFVVLEAVTAIVKRDLDVFMLRDAPARATADIIDDNIPF